LRLATLRTTHGTRAARLEGEEYVLLDAPDLGVLLASGSGWRDAAGRDGDRLPVSEADLATPIPNPEKIFCIGLNYRAHAEEAGLDLPDHPAVFSKYNRALIGPEDPISLPPESKLVDWEAELAIVIGAGGRRLDEATALEAVAGYTVANDVSMRDWQRRTPQWLQGKTFEGSSPVGPLLVTADELGDPAALTIHCALDGETMQEADTSDLIFGPAAIVSYLSSFITLSPGDLILTGTPSGIGSTRKPPRFIEPGMVLTTTIAEIGEMRNVATAEGTEASA
jgi:acylpyruvate hydrolase